MRTAAAFVALCFLAPVLGQNQTPEGEGSTTSYLSSVTIPKGSTGEGVVCIFCSGIIQGHLTGDLVLIGGDAEVDGSVDGDVVVLGGRIRNHGLIGGEAFALGGSIERGRGSKIEGEAESAPWFHFPGQRSFHPAGVLLLLGVMTFLMFFSALIWRRERSDRLADRIVHRWWLALLLGAAVWILYFGFLDEFETTSSRLGILFLAFLLLLFVATWFGSYGIAWAVGRLAWRTAGWKTRLAGAVILSVAFLVPVLGFAAVCLVLIVGLGAGVLFSWPALRAPKAVAIEPSAPGTP